MVGDGEEVGRESEHRSKLRGWGREGRGRREREARRGREGRRRRRGREGRSTFEWRRGRWMSSEVSLVCHDIMPSYWVAHRSQTC